MGGGASSNNVAASPVPRPSSLSLAALLSDALLRTQALPEGGEHLKRVIIEALRCNSAIATMLTNPKKLANHSIAQAQTRSDVQTLQHMLGMMNEYAAEHLDQDPELVQLAEKSVSRCSDVAALFARSVAYTQHHLHLEGILISATEHGLHFSQYTAYITTEIRIQSVPEIFGSTYSPWNEAYDKARMIFGNTTSAAGMRKVVRAEHRELYNHRKSDTHGSLLNGSDFLELFQKGIRQKKHRMYTYAITDDCLFCSETGKVRLILNRDLVLCNP
jgi:hypothetical protein